MSDRRSARHSLFCVEATFSSESLLGPHVAAFADFLASPEIAEPVDIIEKYRFI